MKRLTCLMLALLLLPCLVFTVWAASPPPVSDNEGLLTETEENDLCQRIQQLREEYGIDVMLLTTASFNGETAQEYADGWYDFAGGGDDGVLFLLSLSQREWYISTCGSCIFALTDYGIQQIGEEAADYFSNGYYYEGFVCFLNSLPAYLDAYASGTPIDGYADYSGGYYHGTPEELVYYPEDSSPNFFLSLLIGAVAAAIAVFAMWSTMNTKKSQRTASVYLKDGSWHLLTHRDLFLYSNVTKTRRQQNTNSSGGGSSVHHSSGGRRHGGGGGRF